MFLNSVIYQKATQVQVLLAEVQKNVCSLVCHTPSE